MNAQAPKLEAAENDLKQLMADVTRAMEKAQEAVARIAGHRTNNPAAVCLFQRPRLMIVKEMLRVRESHCA